MVAPSIALLVAALQLAVDVSLPPSPLSFNNAEIGLIVANPEPNASEDAPVSLPNYKQVVRQYPRDLRAAGGAVTKLSLFGKIDPTQDAPRISTDLSDLQGAPSGPST